MRANGIVLVVCVLAGRTFAQEAAPGGALAPIEKAVRSSIERGRIPGAVVHVAVGGKVVLFEAYGSARVGWKLEREALFRIASMTKPITSVGVMMLIEEGKLRLDDPLERYVPEFARAFVVDAQGAKVKLERSITIRDLLTHTSGIGYGLRPPDALKGEWGDVRLADGLNPEDPALETNIRDLARLPLVHQPGEAWTYGMNTDVLGRVIEVASGMAFESFLAERIFRPLGMTETTFRVGPDKAERLAGFYTPGPGAGVKEVTTATLENGDTELGIKRFLGPVHYVSGGAGLVSTASDYARFLQMLLNEGEYHGKRLLKAETVREMTRNQVGELNCGFAVHGDKFGYGFGVTTKPGTATVGSYSWGGMYHTFFWIDPERKLTAIVMTQIWPWGDSTLWEDFQKAVYGSLGDPKSSAPGAAAGASDR